MAPKSAKKPNKTPSQDFFSKKPGTPQGTQAPASLNMTETEAGPPTPDPNLSYKNIEKLLKRELGNLRLDLQRDIAELGQRAAVLEQRFDEMVDAFVPIQASQDTHLLKVTALEEKIEDLENRSRRNNIRIRGVPESFKGPGEAAVSILKELLPDAKNADLILDRAHRALYKPPISGQPRDIIIAVKDFNTKEAAMKAARARSQILFESHPIQLFQDLCPTTLAKRRNLQPLLSILRKKKILYRWGFPFKLSFSYNNAPYAFKSLEEGQRVLQKLQLLPQPNIQSQSAVTDVPKPQRIWEKVRNRKRGRQRPSDWEDQSEDPRPKGKLWSGSSISGSSSELEEDLPREEDET